MDQLFTRQQASPTTVLSTTGSDTSLAAIFTMMMNITVVRMQHVELIMARRRLDYNVIPKDFDERYYLKNDPNKIIAKQPLVDFTNNVTVDKSNV